MAESANRPKFEPSTHRQDVDEPKTFDQLRFEQALEIYRSATSSLMTGLTALTLALVTLLGFAISSQSWGIALVSGSLEPFMLLVINAYVRRIRRVVGVARGIERTAVRGIELTDAILSTAPGTVDTTVQTRKGLLRKTREMVFQRKQTAFICAVSVVHFGITCYLVFGQHWTFAGSSN
jgi:hypothetical protein